MLIHKDKLRFHNVITNPNLCKGIVKCSKVKHHKNSTEPQNDITKYKKQQTLVLKLNRAFKIRYFDNVETLKNSNKI